MRNTLKGAAGVLAFGGLLLAGQATPARAAVEKSLLGIRILSSYKDVLAKFGAPTRVYRSGEVVNFLDAFNANGRPTGGVTGLGDVASNNAAGGPAGGPIGGGPIGGGSMGSPAGMPGGRGPMGMPGGRGPMGMPGSPSGGGSMGSPSGMPGGRGPMGMPGSPSGGGSMGGPAGLGGTPGGGLPGASGAGQQGEGTFAQSGGYSWVYLFPTKELAYQFIFNADNRLIGVYQRGKAYGGVTSKGVRLGDPVRKIYTTYGWPDSTVRQIGMTSLIYNVKSHAQFDTLNNKVVGIAVFLREDQKIMYVGGQTTAGGPGGMGGPGRGPIGAGGGGSMGGGAKGGFGPGDL